MTAVYKVVELGRRGGWAWAILRWWWVALLALLACYLREKCQEHKGYRGLELDDF
jgi:hypothetical protein